MAADKRYFKVQQQTCEHYVQVFEQFLASANLVNADDRNIELYIREFARAGDDGLDNVRAALAQVVTRASVLSRAVAKQIDDHDYNWHIQANVDADVRRHERQDLWILWAQRTARWVMSTALAVILYSFAINLQDHFPTVIHIPIHDWIMSANKH